MQVLNNFKSYLIVLSLAVITFACKDDEDPVIYQVQDVHVDQPGADKPNVKTSTEYISIVYSDVFGKTISNDLLEQLKEIYISFGDVSATEDLIVRNFLKDTDANVPTDQSMRNDIPKFVNDAYKRFYSREPSAQELWFHEQKIKANTDLTPDVFYYALLTSNEYRQY